MKLSEITKNSILYAHKTNLQPSDTDIYLAPVKEIKDGVMSVQIKDKYFEIRPDMANDMWIDDQTGFTFHTTLLSAAQEINTHALIMSSFWGDITDKMGTIIKQELAK